MSSVGVAQRLAQVEQHRLLAAHQPQLAQTLARKGLHYKHCHAVHAGLSHLAEVQLHLGPGGGHLLHEAPGAERHEAGSVPPAVAVLGVTTARLHVVTLLTLLLCWASQAGHPPPSRACAQLFTRRRCGHYETVTVLNTSSS